MKKWLWLFLAVPLIGAGCSAKQGANLNTNASANLNTQAQAPTQVQAYGRAVFGITDAAASLQNVSSVQVTVDKIEAHSASQGWVTVSTDTKTYDLMQLKQSAQTMLLADTQLTTDTYDQVRLHVSGVAVVAGGTTSQAKLPSNELKIVGTVVVKANATASLTLDFQLDKSLHLTGSGKYILAPVVKLVSLSDAQVQVNSDNSLTVEHGTTEADVTVGTDENGNTKAGFMLNTNANLDVTDNGAIQVNAGARGESGLAISASRAVDLAVQSYAIDSALSVKLTTENGKKVWQITGLKGITVTSVYIDAATGAVVSGG